LIYSPNIKIYNTKNKLQATDFTLAESNLAKDSDSKITAKCYCPDPGRLTSYILCIIQVNKGKGVRKVKVGEWLKKSLRRPFKEGS
jgi:hypothetical protein